MTNFIEFSNAFMPQLLQAGFQPLNFNNLDNSTPIMVLYRQEGAVFYTVNIYNLENNDVSKFQDLRQLTITNINGIKNKYDLRYIISYNILITKNEDEKISSFITNSEDYVNQDFYEINYAVFTGSNQLLSARNQPHNIKKIMEMMQNALRADKNNSSEPPANILEASRELTEIKTKTNNSFLTYIIIAVNAALLIMMELSGGSENIRILLDFGAMNYMLFINGEYYRAFTAMFLHIGIMHFLYNSLSLYIFGSRIEKHYGRTAFLIIYLLSGLLGNFANAALAPDVVLAGASSAIFGLLGAAIAITRLTGKNLDGLNFSTMMIFVISGVLFGFMQPNIGNVAHLGGLIGGFILGIIIFKIQGAKDNGGDNRIS